MIYKYVKRPQVIEAIQFDGTNIEEIKQWATCSIIELTDGTFSIETLEGDMHASIGDYIIKGINHEYYPCKPDIFIKTYDKIEENR